MIPAFNEEARLPRYLDEVVTFFDGRGEPWEVVVVDDFHGLVRWTGLRDVADSQCGFKAFREGAAEALFGALETTGLGFDVELLLRTHRCGYRIAEVAVNWTDRPGGKVGVIADGPAILWQIPRARRRVRRA